MRMPGRRKNQPEHEAPRSVTRRFMWFVGLWLASVTLLAIVAFAIRMMIF